MKTVSKEEFVGQYGEQEYNLLDQISGLSQKSQEPSLVNRVKSDIETAGKELGDVYAGEGEYAKYSPLHKATSMAAAAAKGVPAVATEFLPKFARSGLQKVGEGFSAAINWLGEKFGNIPAIQDWAAKNPEATEKLVDSLGIVKDYGDIAGSALAVDMGIRGAVGAPRIAKQALQEAGDIAKTAMSAGKRAVLESGPLQQAPTSIMNRVARLKPSDAREFQRIAGKSHGEYLRDAGNFGAPDTIIKTEAKKFLESKKAVDDALAQLPGEFREGVVADMMEELLKKARRVSTENVKAPYLKRIQELADKYNAGGLTMEEINEVKRLFERNVRLGYNKIVNADAIEQATNLDNALRNWQVMKADELGFKNLREMNKQTQISKFISDKLGEEVIGKSGLNSISLTDWIILSGSSPEAAAAFLTKKFLGTKAVQAKIAEWLNTSPVQKRIVPEMTPKP